MARGGKGAVGLWPEGGGGGAIGLWPGGGGVIINYLSSILAPPQPCARGRMSPPRYATASGSSYVYSDYTFRMSIERCATHLQGATRRVRKVY